MALRLSPESTLTLRELVGVIGNGRTKLLLVWSSTGTGRVTHGELRHYVGGERAEAAIVSLFLSVVGL